MKKLYAYTDGDGFVRFNKLGGKNKALWNQRTGEYDYPEKQYNFPDTRIMWAAIIIGYVIGVVGMVLK